MTLPGLTPARFPLPSGKSRYTCQIGPYMTALDATSAQAAAEAAARQWWGWVAPSSRDRAVDVEVTTSADEVLVVEVVR